MGEKHHSCIVSRELMTTDREVNSPSEISNDFKDLWGWDEEEKVNEILIFSNEILTSYIKLCIMTVDLIGSCLWY